MTRLRLATTIENDLDISVVVPVHNEADNLAELTAEIVSALRGKSTFEIVYVDDASTDTTQAELDRLGNYTRNCGQSRTTSKAGNRSR